MGLTFNELRDANVNRCVEVNTRPENWSPKAWSDCISKACSDVCSEIMRDRKTGTPEDITNQIMDHLAHLVLYADLLANRLNRDLGQAVVQHFNAGSKRLKASTKLEDHAQPFDPSG